MKALMSFVIDVQLFGAVVAHVRVIEFQKRGLPNAHIIFFLNEDANQELRDPAHIDELISAEIPPSSDATLQELVLEHMVHTPCGAGSRSAPCMRELTCLKHFPKPFRSETARLENEYYISYRRRAPSEGGLSVERSCRVGRRQRVVTLDSSWVFPHSPELLRRFACHINVELCVSRLGGIKYLFKYVCQGSDRVTMEIVDENGRHDEIQNFQDARYVSASEAVWRMLAFDIVDRNPPVVRLEVHLEDQHTVFFREGDEHSAANRERAGTKLTEWFVANQKYPGAQHIPYAQFPRYFTWNKSKKCWKLRACLRRRSVSRSQPTSSSAAAVAADLYDFTGSGAHVVGRIYTPSPREGEWYYLRLLLTHTAGATSVQHLCTVDGQQCGSFRQACLKEGLLADDSEWRRALRESFCSSFVPLSHLFATILLYCEPSDPHSLWEQHLSMFLQDIRARHHGIMHALADDERASYYVLLEVQKALQEMGGPLASLSSYGLPTPMQDLPEMRAPAQSLQQIQLELNDTVQAALPLFNERQRLAFNTVVEAILPGVSADSSQGLGGPSMATQPSTRVFLLDAPGGTGKTFLSKAIQATLRLRGKSVLTVVTSAVAAILLECGRTPHSVFRIPITATAESTCNIPVNSHMANRMKNVDLFIWDEIVMCHRFCVKAIDRTLRDITRSQLPFGSKFVLLSGEFWQILPVVRGGSRSVIVNPCIKRSSLFSHFRTLRLTENMRLSALRRDPIVTQKALQFPNTLLQIGEGTLPGTVPPKHPFTLPESVQCVESFRTTVRMVLHGIAQRYIDEDWLTSTVTITAGNYRLPELNDYVGHMIPGAYRTYLSAEKVSNDDGAALQYLVEMLNTLTAGSALPDHLLKVKKAFVVMLLRNVDPSNGHVNGAIYTVEDMQSNVLFLRLASGANRGNALCLPRIPCGPGDDNFPVPNFTRTQFPVRVCFAITTNKAQGQLYSGRIGLDLRDGCFTHGQLYAASSQTTNPSNIVAFLPAGSTSTNNVLYPEVLS